ncbi:hypothetical protein WJX64_12745 [Leifsonia sp. YIM 134122]|uniref:PIN domain-containing protein n=1 Tax=Leifsonia stereocauli TaxID=3134136 RepID=A0ABU9W979_9MICO
MSTFLLPDTTVLVNFALLNQLPALRAYLGARGRACEAVIDEVQDLSAGRVPKLQEVDCIDWFGSPIRIEGVDNIAAVNLLRTAVFGGSALLPRQHLGECQTIHAVRTMSEYSESIVITDDRSAFEYAKGRGMVVRHSVDVMREMVAFDGLDPNMALAWVAFLDADDRGGLLEIPRTSAELVR